MPKRGVQPQVEQAKVYILAHPDESKMQQSIGSGLAERTIARARMELVAAGLLPPSRKRVATPTPTVAQLQAPTPPPPDYIPPAPLPPPVISKDSLRDHAAMQALADLLDTATEEQDDAVVHRRLLKQCLQFAFDPQLHADTRMSASQMWSKLKDMTKARELGPGKPVTREDAIERLSEIMLAVGADITLAAVNRAFTVQEKPDEGNLSAIESEATPGPLGTPEASGSEAPLHEHGDAAGPLALEPDRPANGHPDPGEREP